MSTSNLPDANSIDINNLLFMVVGGALVLNIILCLVGVIVVQIFKFRWSVASVLASMMMGWCALFIFAAIIANFSESILGATGMVFAVAGFVCAMWIMQPDGIQQLVDKEQKRRGKEAEKLAKKVARSAAKSKGSKLTVK